MQCCKQALHQECRDRWLSEAKNASCPFCRQTSDKAVLEVINKKKPGSGPQPAPGAPDDPWMFTMVGS
jgi:hypothetical protein